eukprot:GHVL01039354.1.p1 GENE.GHVL01039354.1~~GHVL01039354.1.p1  ORF type:complete len:678 (+),score=69.25 GHVL01039354.1:34-2067(+)
MTQTFQKTSSKHFESLNADSTTVDSTLKNSERRTQDKSDVFFEDHEWIDILHIVNKARQDVAAGNLLCATNFVLHEAVSCNLVMDPILDPGCMRAKYPITLKLAAKKSIIKFDFDINYTIRLCDLLTSNLSLFLKGSSLQSSMFSCLYYHSRTSSKYWMENINRILASVLGGYLIIIDEIWAFHQSTQVWNTSEVPIQPTNERVPCPRYFLDPEFHGLGSRKKILNEMELILNVLQTRKLDDGPNFLQCLRPLLEDQPKQTALLHRIGLIHTWITMMKRILDGAAARQHKTDLFTTMSPCNLHSVQMTNDSINSSLISARACQYCIRGCADSYSQGCESAKEAFNPWIATASLSTFNSVPVIIDFSSEIKNLNEIFEGCVISLSPPKGTLQPFQNEHAPQKENHNKKFLDWPNLKKWQKDTFESSNNVLVRMIFALITLSTPFDVVSSMPWKEEFDCSSLPSKRFICETDALPCSNNDYLPLDMDLLTLEMWKNSGMPTRVLGEMQRHITSNRKVVKEVKKKKKTLLEIDDEDELLLKNFASVTMSAAPNAPLSNTSDICHELLLGNRNTLYRLMTVYCFSPELCFRKLNRLHPEMTSHMEECSSLESQLATSFDKPIFESHFASRAALNVALEMVTDQLLLGFALQLYSTWELAIIYWFLFHVYNRRSEIVDPVSC